jgi:hypothetical protein
VFPVREQVFEDVGADLSGALGMCQYLREDKWGGRGQMYADEGDFADVLQLAGLGRHLERFKPGLGMPELKLQIWLYRRAGMFAASRPLFFHA